MIDDADFAKLMQATADLAKSFPDGMVYIGGIATYLHSINNAQTMNLAETTHDADLYISLSDMADLREMEELTSNRRLGKHQIIKKGFEFDVYTERQSSLRVPYDEVMAHSQQYDALKVACPEHLLVLKLAAYEDRRGSIKGEKDARDIVRLVVVMQNSQRHMDPSLILPYWSGDELDDLRQIAKGSAPTALTKGNAHEAKGFRMALRDAIELLENQSPALAPLKRPQRK